LFTLGIEARASSLAYIMSKNPQIGFGLLNVSDSDLHKSISDLTNIITANFLNKLRDEVIKEKMTYVPYKLFNDEFFYYKVIARLPKTDSLWDISKRFFSRGKYWEILWEHNKPMAANNPNLIYPEEIVKIPYKIIIEKMRINKEIPSDSFIGFEFN